MGSGPRRQQLLLKVSRVPDWGRRAIRLSLALIFFTTLGLTLWLVPGGWDLGFLRPQIISQRGPAF